MSIDINVALMRLIDRSIAIPARRGSVANVIPRALVLHDKVQISCFVEHVRRDHSNWLLHHRYARSAPFRPMRNTCAVRSGGRARARCTTQLGSFSIRYIIKRWERGAGERITYICSQRPDSSRMYKLLHVRILRMALSLSLSPALSSSSSFSLSLSPFDDAESYLFVSERNVTHKTSIFRRWFMQEVMFIW